MNEKKLTDEERSAEIQFLTILLLATYLPESWKGILMREIQYERLLDATYNTADMVVALADALAKGNLMDADAMTRISETAKRESEGRKQYEALRKGPYYL